MSFALPSLPRAWVAVGALVLAAISPARGDIFEWEHINAANPGLGKREGTTLVPGGAGVTAVPWADLQGRNLTKAYLIGKNLTGAYFFAATLTDTDFTGADVRGVDFSGVTSRGFTASQLDTTASYQARDLTGIVFYNNDLSGWDFTGQNLANVGFYGATLTGADLNGADARGARNLFIPANATADNLIRPDGFVVGLNLPDGERLVVRDYDDDVIFGEPLIPVHIADHFAISEGGVLQLVFEADDWDSTISFAAGIAVNLDGTLELSFASDVDIASQVGRTLRLFDWAGVAPIGRFNAVQS